MKNLKHIKLFEAFDARTLNATLKHVKLSGDRKKFLDALNVVCKRFDIPESKLSDDLFTYLPFNRALRYNNVVEEEQICDARGEFIVGEKCDNGKVRRFNSPLNNRTEIESKRFKNYTSNIDKVLESAKPIVPTNTIQEEVLQNDGDKIQLYGNVYANKGQTSAIQNFREFINSTNKSFL